MTQIRNRTVIARRVFWLIYTLAYIHLNFKYNITHSFDSFVMLYAFSFPIGYAISLTLFGVKDEER